MSLDPDQTRRLHVFMTDLDQNCLQRLSADDTRGQRVKGDSNPNNKYVLSERAI